MLLRHRDTLLIVCSVKRAHTAEFARRRSNFFRIVDHSAGGAGGGAKRKSAIYPI